MDAIQSFCDFVGQNVAAIIALCALGLTVYQAGIARRHNRLSVRPSLTSFTHRAVGHDARFAVTLENNGLGPAVIDSFEVTLGGQPLNVHNRDEVLTALAHFL